MSTIPVSRRSTLFIQPSQAVEKHPPQESKHYDAGSIMRGRASTIQPAHLPYDSQEVDLPSYWAEKYSPQHEEQLGITFPSYVLDETTGRFKKKQGEAPEKIKKTIAKKPPPRNKGILSFQIVSFEKEGHLKISTQEGDSTKTKHYKPNKRSSGRK